ncbi:MAG: hypothetical protein HOE45_09725 [Gammaproteobacteria bacterium]|jgi:hypothetical protein|uniref:hypothetical protein n=1 Tax=Methyloprofundus sp. TaxID=2020875 RepID=UPI001A17DAC7|nr:hypothetical protein [Methyloprofundus sp.]MBT3813531.1 hypothetical protein [Gammaproteobacteria bacterium]HIL77762.1 hypothetical protein [Methylococcales bacterium]MBT4147131.1 hypothetical protein [Gammaproteobacteria bacterium]MBT5223552.1 hypothetical protein [Gammaproteobacteria bacterium]MBT5825852.1 hypothetical protein [Gammaproteobacteria bacterium]
MKLKQALLAGVVLLFSISANADVSLEDNSQIVGKWILFAESAALHKEKVELFSIWDFRKDGVIHTESEDRFGRTKTLKINLKYIVEDGVVKKQVNPGRTKMETCKVIKLEGGEMTLKCTFVFLFFKR